MNGQNLKNDYLPEVAFLFYLLLLTYFIKFSNFVDFDFTVVGWFLFSIYALIRIRLRVILWIGVFHLVLSFFYFSGLHLDDQGDGGVYGKVLLTSFFLTSTTFGFLSGEVRGYKISFFDIFYSRFFIYLCYGLLVYWVIFIFNASSFLGDYLVKDYGGANYLTTSDLLAMFSLALIGSSRTSLFESICFALITIVALVLLGSRASMTLFAACYLVAIKNLSLPKKLAGSLFFVFALFLGLIFIENAESGLFYRFNSIFTLGDDDSSFARSELFSKYFDNLFANPICFALPCPPAAGNYVHNILSVHQYFGLMVFLVILSLLLLSFLQIKSYFSGPFFALLAYSFIQVLFFRSWVSLTFPIFLALILLSFTQLKAKSKK